MVEFFFEDVEHMVPPNKFKAWVNKVETENDINLDLTYIFCSDEKIIEVNREFLNHDYFTDIITFDLSDEGSETIEGEIYISIDTVRTNSEKYNSSFIKELTRVMCHGVFHLLGHEDKTEEEIKQMRALESDAIKQIL